MTIREKISNNLKEIGYFISSNYFLKNFAYMAGIFLVISILLFWLILPTYTRHNVGVEVNDLHNLSVDKARKLIESKGLRLVVTDSVYEPNKTSGVILEQLPKAKAMVKPSRTIYVTVNTANAPLVNIYYKQVIGRHLSAVERKFKSIGVKVGKLRFIPGKAGKTIAKISLNGKVLFKEADPRRGEKPPTGPERIPRGATIDLELYKGEAAEVQQEDSDAEEDIENLDEETTTEENTNQ